MREEDTEGCTGCDSTDRKHAGQLIHGCREWVPVVGLGSRGVIADGSDENVYFSHGCILRAYNSAGNIVDIQ